MAETIKLKPYTVDLYHHKRTDTMYISIPSLLSVLRGDAIKFLESKEPESKTIAKYIINCLIKRTEKLLEERKTDS